MKLKDSSTGPSGQAGVEHGTYENLRDLDIFSWERERLQRGLAAATRHPQGKDLQGRHNQTSLRRIGRGSTRHNWDKLWHEEF